MRDVEFVLIVRDVTRNPNITLWRYEDHERQRPFNYAPVRSYSGSVTVEPLVRRSNNG